MLLYGVADHQCDKVGLESDVLFSCGGVWVDMLSNLTVVSA